MEQIQPLSIANTCIIDQIIEDLSQLFTDAKIYQGDIYFDFTLRKADFFITGQSLTDICQSKIPKKLNINFTSTPIDFIKYMLARATSAINTDYIPTIKDLLYPPHGPIKTSCFCYMPDKYHPLNPTSISPLSIQIAAGHRFIICPSSPESALKKFSFSHQKMYYSPQFKQAFGTLASMSCAKLKVLQYQNTSNALAALFEAFKLVKDGYSCDPFDIYILLSNLRDHPCNPIHQLPIEHPRFLEACSSTEIDPSTENIASWMNVLLS